MQDIKRRGAGAGVGVGLLRGRRIPLLETLKVSWFLGVWFLGFLVSRFLDFLVSKCRGFLASKFLGFLVSKFQSVIQPLHLILLEMVDPMLPIFHVVLFEKILE